MRKILTYRRLNMIRTRFQENGIIFLFIARFLPGLRAAIYLFSGITRRVSYLKFIAIDFSAAIISVPIWVYLGYLFGDNLPYLKGLVHRIGLGVSISAIVLVIVAIFIIRRQIKEKAAKREEERLTRAKFFKEQEIRQHSNQTSNQDTLEQDSPEQTSSQTPTSSSATTTQSGKDTNLAGSSSVSSAENSNSLSSKSKAESSVRDSRTSKTPRRSSVASDEDITPEELLLLEETLEATKARLRRKGMKAKS